jgi:hydrogenase expression/formation protein HypC
MCLAIPAEIIDIDDQGMANCRVGESDTYIKVATMLMEEPPKVGDFLIVHAGFALRTLDHEEAQETLRLLRQMVEAQGEVAGF